MMKRCNHCKRQYPDTPARLASCVGCGAPLAFVDEVELDCVQHRGLHGVIAEVCYDRRGLEVQR